MLFGFGLFGGFIYFGWDYLFCCLLSSFCGWLLVYLLYCVFRLLVMWFLGLCFVRFAGGLVVMLLIYLFVVYGCCLVMWLLFDVAVVVWVALI